MSCQHLIPRDDCFECQLEVKSREGLKMSDQSSKPIYILIFERYGNREGHHYIGGLYSDLAVATIEGLEHELYRGNKYELRLEISYLDSNEPNKEVPREVAINMAKLKFPEKFDDRNCLKEPTE